MRSKLVMAALAAGLGVAALSSPAAAQTYYEPGYYGPGADGGIYGPRAYRGPGYYYRGPAIGPLSYGDGWVPEPIYQHSRPGGVDPNVRPSN